MVVEDGKGTNPEELLGAATRAGSQWRCRSCWAVQDRADYIDATAQVTILPEDGGFGITKSHLVCEAAVPGIDAATFARHAEAAKAGCPVSRALAGTTITLDAKLAR